MQVGDNTTAVRSTPVSVVGLSSDVAFVSLGSVRIEVWGCMRVCCVFATYILLLDCVCGVTSWCFALIELVVVRAIDLLWRMMLMADGGQCVFRVMRAVSC